MKEIMSIREWFILAVTAICLFSGMPNANACDKPIVVDTWEQEAPTGKGKIVVRQFCPLEGPAAVLVVDAVKKSVTETKPERVSVTIPSAPVVDAVKKSVETKGSIINKPVTYRIEAEDYSINCVLQNK